MKQYYPKWSLITENVGWYTDATLVGNIVLVSILFDTIKNWYRWETDWSFKIIECFTVMNSQSKTTLWIDLRVSVPDTDIHN